MSSPVFVGGEIQKMFNNVFFFLSEARCPAGCMLQARGALLIMDEICTHSRRDELSQTSSWMKDQSFVLWVQYYFIFLQAGSKSEKPSGLESHLAFWAGIHFLTKYCLSHWKIRN